MNATDPSGLCKDDDYLCDVDEVFDYIESEFDSAAASVQAYTGVSIPDEFLPSPQTLLANNSNDAAESEDGSSTITAQGALVGTAMAAGNLPGVGAVANAGLAGYYAYQGEYGTAAAFGGAAVASMVGLPGGSEIADGVEAVGEAEAVATPAIEAAAESSDVLYHYTTQEGMQGILDSQELYPSLQAANPNDARYGNGQYLSDIEPGTMTNAQLSRSFIGQPFQGGWFTNYVSVDVTGLNVLMGRPGVYVIPNEVSLDLSGRIVGWGIN